MKAACTSLWALVAFLGYIGMVESWSPLSSSQVVSPHVSLDNRRHATVLQAVTESRRSFASSMVMASGIMGLVGGSCPTSATADEDSQDFTSISERAAKISKAIQEEGEEERASSASKVTARPNDDTRTAYDFALPMAGQAVSFRDLVRHSDEDITSTTSDVNTDLPLPKAILVVNIKQDDPIARKNIPELIALAAKFGRGGQFTVVSCPTDQGYYEPDTSALIRLKLASEYGYGINPATVITDKVNLSGTGAHPFWRWLEGRCRTPSGLGTIQANFEKFLIDGNTGLPLRRYPRKYMPYDMQDDIEALLAGKPLPPPGSNYREEWRTAVKEAERDTYRFQKGLNVFDQ